RPACMPESVETLSNRGPGSSWRRVMGLKDLRNCRPGRGTRSRSLYAHAERLESRAVPAGYTAACVPELVAAINMANLTAEADTITLAAAATFTLSSPDNNTDGSTGLPVIIASGGSLSIVGNGALVERSTAADVPAFRLFDVALGASLTLQDVT